jgi:hypothetical protein
MSLYCSGECCAHTTRKISSAEISDSRPADADDSKPGRHSRSCVRAGLLLAGLAFKIGYPILYDKFVRLCAVAAAGLGAKLKQYFGAPCIAFECAIHQLLEQQLKGRALQLILTGETISAQEAYRIGLVNEVVPAANLIARAETILKQIMANAPIAVKFSLEAANKGLDTSQAEGFALEASYFGICAATEDKKEGTSAFLEKRAPQFHGR